MTPLRNTIGLLVLGIAFVALCEREVNAGRFGGTSSYSATLRPGESAYFDVLLVAGQPARLSAYSLGQADLELHIYDGDGHVWAGSGPWGRKSAKLNVYRTGPFQVELYNAGPAESTFMLRVN